MRRGFRVEHYVLGASFKSSRDRNCLFLWGQPSWINIQQLAVVMEITRMYSQCHKLWTILCPFLHFPEFDMALSVIYNYQVDISRRVTLEGLPKILILHLKRFIYSKAGSQKLQKVVDYPLELTIGKGNSKEDVFFCIFNIHKYCKKVIKTPLLRCCHTASIDVGNNRTIIIFIARQVAERRYNIHSSVTPYLATALHCKLPEVTAPLDFILFVGTCHPTHCKSLSL